MCPDYIPVGFITAGATVVSVARFMSLSTVRAGLGSVGFVNYLKAYSLGIEFVCQIFLNLPKIPVREFLRDFSLADFLTSFSSTPVLFLPTRSVSLHSLWVSTEYVFYLVFYAPVHEILGDFMSFMFYLVAGFGEDKTLLALKLLPPSGTLFALSLGFLDFPY